MISDTAKAHTTYADWRGKLIVSCQAAPNTPLNNPEILAAIAQTAVAGGAVGIRANHGVNIAAIRQKVTVPIIGLKKREVPGYPVYITPEWRDVLEVYNAGANIIALDATHRDRPGPENFEDLCRRIHGELPGIMVMADVATFEEGIDAANAGADFVGTTMSGYTEQTQKVVKTRPDIALVARLAIIIPDTPIICEGRIKSPAEAKEALNAGAFAVVVGTAITAPQWITEQYISAMAG